MQARVISLPVVAGGGLHEGMQWYYSIDGQRSGPVPHAELERLIQAGTIKGDTLLWRQGLDQWKSLDDVQTRDPAMFARPLPPPLPQAPSSPPSSDAARERLEAGGWAHSTENVNRVPQSERRPMRLEAEEARPAAPEVLIYAGFWRRAGAFCVDLLIWGVVLQILTSIIGVRFFPEALKLLEEANQAGAWSYQPTPEDVAILLPFYGMLFLVTVGWAVLYDLLFIPRFAATPGKMVFGLQLVTARNKPLGSGRILARALARMLSGWPTLFIGFLVVGVDDQKRGLHDFFCSTRVVKKRRD